MAARRITPYKADPKAPPYAVETLLDCTRQVDAHADPALLDTPGLRVLAKNLEGIAPHLTFLSRGRAQKLLVETLVKRTRLATYLQRYPEIAGIRLQSPIFLVGPPRTGTTFLHRLLSQDPAHRTPRLWEALQAPPAEPAHVGEPSYFEMDYRVPIARAYLETRARFSPQMAGIHPTSVDAPEECFGLVETSLLSHSFMFYGPVLDYLEWLDGQDDDAWRGAYRLYADQLRLLHWFAPGERWVLKTPFHLWAVDAIFASFPDAVIVQQHRTPATCVASFCSLTAEAYAPLISSIDHAQIGQIALGYLRKALARNGAQRTRFDSARFVDIDYRDLMADPIECVRTIYRAAGTELTPEVGAAMAEWLAGQKRDGKKGGHQYTLSDYALEESEVNAAFEPYSAFNPRHRQD